MKTWFTLLLVFCITTVFAVEGNKEYKQTFQASEFDELIVSNRFGTVDVRQEGNEFSITATVWVEAKTDAKVDEILDFINVTFLKQGKILRVETGFDKNMSLKQLISSVVVGVDYKVKIPVGKKLHVVSLDGGVLMGNFKGDLNVEVISGDFTARNITGGIFTLKHEKGEMEAKKIDELKGEFKSAQVNIEDCDIMKLDCNSSNIRIMSVDDLVVRSSGGSFYIGDVETIKANSSYTKYEIQDLGGKMNMDMKWGEVNVRNVNPSFSNIDLKSTYTKVGFSFMDGCGYNLDLTRNKNLKVDLAHDIVLKSKPTSTKSIVYESGFVGDPIHSGKVVLNVNKGSLFIQ